MSLDLAHHATPSGQFSYDPMSRVLTWSEAVFRIHGFGPGDVVPSLELMLSHKHPDDRDVAQSLLAEVCESGRPFSFWHRLLDAQGATRYVLTVGGGVLDEAGAVVGVTGCITDLTEVVRRATSREVDAAIEAIVASRATIEQAKGALMLTYRIDEDRAFRLLRRYSQVFNVKVRDVAGQLVEAMGRSGLPADVRAAWDDLAHRELGVSTSGGLCAQCAE